MELLNTLYDPPCKPEICQSPSILTNLKNDQLRLTKRLADINAAIEALEKNPEINNVLELIAKTR